MMDMYGSVLPGMKAKTFVDQIFQKFDSDDSGTIDFKVTIWNNPKGLKVSKTPKMTDWQVDQLARVNIEEMHYPWLKIACFMSLIIKT